MKFVLLLATLVLQCHALEIAKFSIKRAVNKAKKVVTGDRGGDGKIYATSANNSILFDKIINQYLSPVNITRWLTDGNNSNSTKPSPPTYMATTDNGTVDEYNMCPTLFKAESGAKLTDKQCFSALVQYLGNSGNGSFGNAAARLNSAMTALSVAVDASVTATDSMKDKIRQIVKAVLWSHRIDGGRDKQKKILNQEVQLRNMISLIRTSLNSVKNLPELTSFINSLGDNIEKFDEARRGKYDALTGNISDTVGTLWENVKTNIPRLQRRSQQDEGYIDGNITQASYARSEAWRLVQFAFAGLNTTENTTQSSIQAQVTNFSSYRFNLSAGLHTMVKNALNEVVLDQGKKLGLTLGNISNDFLTLVPQTRAPFSQAVLLNIDSYNSSFSNALSGKSFENSMLALKNKVGDSIRQTDEDMQRIIMSINGRVSTLRNGISSLRVSDTQQASQMATDLSEYLTKLNSANSAMTTASSELLDRIATNKTDLLSQVQSASSGKMDFLFKNIVNALSQVATIKKAALENIKAKLASMDAYIARLVAASGLSAEEFFHKIDTVANKLNRNQATIKIASSDANAQSTDQMRSLSRSVMNIMSTQAARMSQNAMALQAGQQRSKNQLNAAFVGVVNDVGGKVTEATNILAAATTQADRENSKLKMDVTNTVLGMGPDFKTVSNAVKLLDAQIQSVVDGAASLGADKLASVISVRMADIADQMQQMIADLYLVTVENGKLDLVKGNSAQNNKVVENGEALTKLIAQMSDTLNQTENPFFSAVEYLKVATVQDAIDKIGLALTSAWSAFESDAIDQKITSLNVTTTDLATISGDVQKFATKRSEISDSLAKLKTEVSVTDLLDEMRRHQGKFSAKLATVSSSIAALFSSADGVMSDSSDTGISGLGKILTLSKNISDFVSKVSADSTAQNRSAYARKSAVDQSGLDLMMEAGGVFSEARTIFQTKLDIILNKAGADSESVKALFDSSQIGVAIPTVTSMEALNNLIDDLFIYGNSLPKLTETVEDENTELMMINIFAPLIKYIQFANESVLAQARASADGPQLEQTISWTGAVANSTWDAAQSAAALGNSQLIRAASESALNNQLIDFQLTKNRGVLYAQVTETEATVNASVIATEDATNGTGHALINAASDFSGTSSAIAGTFWNATADLSAWENGFATSIASSGSSVANLSKGFNDLISGTLTELMQEFTGMADQFSQQLPNTASIAVDAEKDRVIGSFNQVTQSISTTSDMINADWQQANANLRNIELHTRRFETIGAAINAMKNDILVLENAAVAQANKDADDAVEAEKARISEDFASITVSLAHLNETAYDKIFQLSS